MSGSRLRPGSWIRAATRSACCSSRIRGRGELRGSGSAVRDRRPRFTPAYFRWLLDHGRAEERFAQLGSRIFGLRGDQPARAEGFVEQFEAWLQENGLWQSLTDLGFSDADYAAVAHTPSSHTATANSSTPWDRYRPRRSSRSSVTHRAAAHARLSGPAAPHSRTKEH